MKLAKGVPEGMLLAPGPAPGRVSERATRLFFTGLFAVIGVTFLLAFTVFRARFA